MYTTLIQLELCNHSIKKIMDAYNLYFRRKGKNYKFDPLTLLCRFQIRRSNNI